jgi:hypothetical protein
MLLPLFSIGRHRRIRGHPSRGPAVHCSPSKAIWQLSIHSRLEAEFLNEIQTKVLRISSLLFTVTSTALPGNVYFFKLTQPLTVSVKEKGGKPDKNRTPFPMV